jgi:cytochrome c556
MRGLLAFLLAPLAASCAVNVANDAPPPPPAAPSLSPAEIVAARQAAFNLTAATFGGMRSAVEGGGDVKPLAFGARGLARWAQALPAMFPEGTELPSSRALASVWQDRAGLEARAAEFAAAAAQLQAAAAAGDKAAFAAAYKATGAACSSCHDRYRAEPPR